MTATVHLSFRSSSLSVDGPHIAHVRYVRSCYLYSDILRHECCSCDGSGIQIDTQDGRCPSYTIMHCKFIR